jgi:hypothetical protein
MSHGENQPVEQMDLNDISQYRDARGSTLLLPHSRPQSRTCSWSPVVEHEARFLKLEELKVHTGASS